MRDRDASADLLLTLHLGRGWAVICDVSLLAKSSPHQTCRSRLGGFRFTHDRRRSHPARPATVGELDPPSRAAGRRHESISTGGFTAANGSPVTVRICLRVQAVSAVSSTRT